MQNAIKRLFLKIFFLFRSQVPHGDRFLRKLPCGLFVQNHLVIGETRKRKKKKKGI